MEANAARLAVPTLEPLDQRVVSIFHEQALPRWTLLDNADLSKQAAVPDMDGTSAG